MANKIKIVELFSSIQGEPKSVGKSAIFIRFPFCTLNCTWCDTKYASQAKKSDYVEMTVEDIVKEILKYPNTELLVFTGGEPLMNQKEILAITDLLAENQEHYYEVEVETNGTIYPKLLEEKCKFDVRYNCSPKLESSGNLLKVRYQPDILKGIRDLDSLFKFVVKTKKDWKEVEHIVKDIKINNESVYIMAEGTERIRWVHHAIKLVDQVKEKGWNLAPRMQILLWGKKKNK